MADKSTRDGGEVIRLSARYHYFVMADSYCATPDCPCRVVNLEFAECDRHGAAVHDPIKFSIDLNIDNWREDTGSARSERSEITRRLVEDFLADLSDETKTKLRERHEQLKSRAAALASFTMPVEEVEQGILVAYSDIFRTPEEIASGTRRPSFSFTHQGRTYFVDDLYCANPKCKCNQASLLFLGYEEDGEDTRTASDLFRATMPFGKRLKIEKPTQCSEPQATALAEQWQVAYPNVLNELKRRHAAVKEIGKRIIREGRSAAGARLAVDRSAGAASAQTSSGLRMTSRASSQDRSEGLPIRAGEKIGPNTPCPCGSGKKYKKCCMRR